MSRVGPPTPTPLSETCLPWAREFNLFVIVRLATRTLARGAALPSIREATITPGVRIDPVVAREVASIPPC